MTLSHNLLPVEVTAKNRRKFRPKQLHVEFIDKGLTEDPKVQMLSGITGPIHLPDMTSLVASGRLKNAIEYCTKVVRKRVWLANK